jgi:UDP-2,3-diacylglucosamine hydrolase
VVELLSDLHLSAATPHTTAAFLNYLTSCQANQIYVLGDWFDAWIGPEQAGEEPARSVGLAVKQRAIEGLQIHFMPGNRDFLLSEGTLRSWGVSLLSDPYRLQVGRTTCLLTHGDALCLTDTDYQAFRRLARSTQWQTQFLAQPYPERRALALQLRAESENAKRFKPLETMDIDQGEAIRWLSAARADILIHGHTHQPGSSSLPESRVRYVLSDWDLDLGLPSDHRAEVLRLLTHEDQLSIERVSLA